LNFERNPSDFACAAAVRLGRFSVMSQQMPNAPKILPTHTPELFDAAVRRAAALLRAGEVVALPTETVYGLAANALDARAVAKIFEAKGRPAHNPIIVHVSSLEMARRCASQWPEAAGRLAASFWPGPLTVVLPRAADIPDIVTAGGPTVGIRWPSHPLMQAVIRESGFPLAAPSANPSGQVSPTNAEHVRRLLGSRLPLIVDGGQSQVGIESTVIDLTTQPARVLRPGMIHEESLVAALGSEVRGPTFHAPGRADLPVGRDAPQRVPTRFIGPMRDFGIEEAPDLPGRGALRSPGQLEKHYSPKARVLVLEWSETESLRAQLAGRRIPEAECHVVAHSRIPAAERFAAVSVIPHDAEAFARALYAEFHRCDEAGARVIVVEAVPDRPEWRGVADRLRRAGAAS
jgi:L-threonylcarbamoyladenylate synthase